MIKDAQFNKFIKYKKYVDVFDFASIECKIALISAIALAGVSYFSTRNNTLENINIEIKKEAKRKGEILEELSYGFTEG